MKTTYFIAVLIALMSSVAADSALACGEVSDVLDTADASDGAGSSASSSGSGSSSTSAD
jgi:hypothetical protein